MFNICVSNTDDHASNHAAFWNARIETGSTDLTLTSAYDICPRNRSGGETASAMAIGRSGFRMSQLAGWIEAADVYLLSRQEAADIIAAQLETIHARWADAADTAELAITERASLWGRQILNPCALEGIPG